MNRSVVPTKNQAATFSANFWKYALENPSNLILQPVLVPLLSFLGLADHQPATFLSTRPLSMLSPHHGARAKETVQGWSREQLGGGVLGRKLAFCVFIWGMFIRDSKNWSCMLLQGVRSKKGFVFLNHFVNWGSEAPRGGERASKTAFVFKWVC